MQGIDFLVVGCGLTAGVIARHLAERLDKKVLIWERRNHIGGNLYDYADEHNILVQKYGPHTFHTKNKKVYEYISRFSKWNLYHLTCRVDIDGVKTPSPFNFQTIDDFFSIDIAEEIKNQLRIQYGTREMVTVLEVLNNKNELLRKYGEFLFEKDYSLYTAKQWGISPDKIDASVLERVPIRLSYKDGYFDDPYQVMPQISFTDFFIHLLDHPNIRVEFGIEALDHLKIQDGNRIFLDGSPFNIPVIYTGALDELFGCCNGMLPYRSLRFEWHYEDIESKQPAPVVVYPQAADYTRITEYKKLPIQEVKGSTYAVEFPLAYQTASKLEPYYPVLTDESRKQFQSYQKLESLIPTLYCCGRLADFKYYNMDQAIERAFELCDILEVNYQI